VLNHFKRNLHTAIVLLLPLLLLLPAASAFGANGAHHRKADPRTRHKPGAVVHRTRFRSAAGATGVLLGDTYVEWQYDSLVAGQAEAFRLPAGTSGLAGAAHIYISAKNTAGTLIAGLYSSVGGHPGTLLSTGSTQASKPGTWTTVSIAPVELVSGWSYWLAILGRGGRLRYRDRALGPCPSETSASRDLRALPSSWRTGTTYSDCPASAYVTAAPLAAPTHSSSPVLASAVTEQPAVLEEPPAAAPPAAPVATAPPIVSGNATEGQLLVASSGSWSGAPTSFEYQWQRCSSGADCANVSGATASTYMLGYGDVGNTLRVAVTASNTIGATSATSPTTAEVAPLAPANTHPPEISGVTEEGQTLTASTGSWEGTPPLTYGYQWQECSATGEHCSNIAHATSASYELAASDVGHTVTAVVSATNRAGSANATAAPSAVVTAPPPGAPVDEVLPSIDGTAHVGDKLTLEDGAWSNDPTSYTYQWNDCDQAKGDCTPISGATANSYTVSSSDVGDTVGALVTAHNGAGSGSATAPATETVTGPSHRTFYISYSAGSESNSGTSESSPWKRAPGMHEFSAAYSHEAGDHFIFEGGVTWPNETLPLAPPEGRTGSGEAGDPDVYGVNESWHAGAGYKAPIFDAEGKEVTNGCSHENCSDYNVFVNLSDDDYITIEGIHFIGWANTKHEPYGTCGVIFFEDNENESPYQTDEHITIDNVTINEFTVGDKVESPQLVADEPSQESEGRRCAAIVGRSGNSTSPEGESLVENSTIEGVPTKDVPPYGGSWVEGIRNVPNAIDDTVKYMNNMYFPGGGGGTIAGNLFEDCGYPEFDEGYQGEDHANVMEFADTEAQRTAGKPFYIYDNVIDGSGDNGHAQCESSFLGRGTVYMWNNVYFHVHGNPPELEANENAVGKDYIWNNTLEGSGLGQGPCIQQGHSGFVMELVVVQNNLCIGEGEVAARTGGHKLEADTVTEDHNLVLARSKAAADGYTTSERFVYSPTSEHAPTVGAGVNLHALCTGALAGLCEDTDYAGARSPVARPASGNWDIGAYEW
jgi:hypothetical protein